MRKVPRAEAEQLVFPPQPADTPAMARSIKAEVNRTIKDEAAAPHPSTKHVVEDDDDRLDWPEPEDLD